MSGGRIPSLRRAGCFRPAHENPMKSRVLSLGTALACWGALAHVPIPIAATFADADNDAIHLTNGDLAISNTVLGFTKDDGIDSGANGSDNSYTSAQAHGVLPPAQVNRESAVLVKSALLHTTLLAATAARLAAADYGTDSTIPKTDSPTPPPAKAAAGVREVVIVYKTHFDIGYTARASEVIHEYRTGMADRLLAAIERNRDQPKEQQFVWTLSGFPMREILWDGQDPKRRQAIEDAIRAGNIAIHAYPYTTLTEIAEPEDLVRGLNISSNLARRLGQPLSISANDFARLLLAGNPTGIPVVRGDIPDPWIHGTMSMPEGAKLARNGRLRIGALDALTTLERAWGIHRPDLRPTIAAAYDQAGLYCEHTWGLANQHYVKLPWGRDWDKLWNEGLPPNFRCMEDSWNDHIGYARNAAWLTDEPYREALATLADHVSVPGHRIVVHNPLPWTRDGEAVVNAFHFPSGAGLRPVDGGPPIACVAEGPGIETPDRIRRFIARDIPPCGYRTYVVTNETPPPPLLVADSANRTIESPFFKAVLDPPRGCVASLIDKRSGRELVDPAAPHGFGQYFYERFSWQNLEDWLNASLYPQYRAHRFAFTAYDMPRDVPYAAAAAGNLSLEVKRTAIDVTAVMTGTLPGPGQPQQISIRLTLPATIPAADLTVDWRKQPDSWPEAAWICLPFKVSHPEFRLGKLGGDLDPVKDVEVEQANHHNSWVNTGAAVFDGQTGAGVGVCPIDSPMVSLGEPGEYKFSARYVPSAPSIYLNLYNNHWRTNFAAWVGDGSRMSSRVRIWSFDRFAPESALFTPAMEARVPLAASRSACAPGSLPPARADLTLSRKGVSLTAFGPDPDGDGTVLRVWEQSGTGGDLTITLPPGFLSAIPVNLRGEPAGEEIPVRDNRFTTPLGRYAPASFILN